MIEFHAATVERGTFTLGPIDLSIGRGTTFLVGRNGAGKTTLMRSTVGLEPLAAGRIVVAGIDMASRRDHRDVMRRIGFVPQSVAIPPSARVEDVVSYAAWLKGLSRQDTRTRVTEALEALDVGAFRKRIVRGLSGGERQRVSIAMSLVHRPDVLLLDEPSAGLDPIQRVSLRRLLDRIAHDRAVVISTHIVEDLGTDDHDFVVLDQGTIRYTGGAPGLRALADDGAGPASLERGIWHVLGGAEHP